MIANIVRQWVDLVAGSDSERVQNWMKYQELEMYDRRTRSIDRAKENRVFGAADALRGLAQPDAMPIFPSDFVVTRGLASLLQLSIFINAEYISAQASMPRVEVILAREEIDELGERMLMLSRSLEYRLRWMEATFPRPSILADWEGFGVRASFPCPHPEEELDECIRRLSFATKFACRRLVAFFRRAGIPLLFIDCLRARGSAVAYLLDESSLSRHAGSTILLEYKDSIGYRSVSYSAGAVVPTALDISMYEGLEYVSYPGDALMRERLENT